MMVDYLSRIINKRIDLFKDLPFSIQMVEKKTQINESIFQELINKIVENSGLPVLIINSKKIDDLLDILKKDASFFQHFSEVELRQEIGIFLSSLQESPQEKKDTLEVKIKNFFNKLFREKKYTAIIIIDGIYGIPIDTKIGSFEITEPDFSNSNFSERLKRVQEDIGHTLKDCLWGKICFTSYKIHNVHHILYQKLEFPFSILTFILGKKVDPNEVIGAIFSDEGEMFAINHFKGSSRVNYNNKNEKQLQRLSEISIKTKPTEVESKILRSLDIFWLSQLTPKKEVEFLLLISTLESLLLTKNDRDYLGQRLAEKSAFLLENNEENRIQTYKTIKKLYNLRSKLVHEGEKKIDENELNQLKPLVYQIIIKMIELSSIYDKMELKSKPTDKDGIDDMFLKLKF